MEIVILMALTSIIITSHQEVPIYHIFSVCYLILICLEESGSILMDNQSVNCNSNSDSDPLSCIVSNNSANITVYRPSGNQQLYEVSISGSQSIGGDMFKCCLPSNCSDPTTNIITIHIFSKLYLIVLVHTVICY